MNTRKDVTVTLEASPSNSLVVRSTPGCDRRAASNLKESPNFVGWALFQSASHCHRLSAGPSDAAAIERIRFQRPLHFIADNHSSKSPKKQWH